MPSNGMNMPTNDKKLEELIVYIAKKCGDHTRFGAIKLNKILFYADFQSYRARGKSITGAEYQKLPLGPAPRGMGGLLKKMEREESIFVYDKPVNVGGETKKQKRACAMREPDTSVFSAGELAIVDAMIADFEDLTANEISEITHRTLGWRLASMKETIPYFTVFLGEGSAPLTASDIAIGEKIAASL